MTKVAINGFGRIGRLFLKQSLSNKDFEVVAINDLGDLENLAYLLKYDTVYGNWDQDVKTDGSVSSPQGSRLLVNGKKIKFLQMKDATLLPWKKLGIDIVIEATGVFESYEKAKVHINAGAKRVVITAPAKDDDGPVRSPDGDHRASTGGKTVLMGVNENEMKKVFITSNGSCTTNAASPVIQVLSDNPGIKKAVLSTVHGYTATQSIVDGPVKGSDFRRGRAAAQNIVLSTTGAAIAVTRAISELTGKFDGVSFRVPTVAGSIADITFVSKRKTSVEEINEILRKAANSSKWRGIMKATEEQLVSSDILGQPYGAIVDLSFTKVIDGDLVKVLSWYDNEAGYVSTLIKHVASVAMLV